MQIMKKLPKNKPNSYFKHTQDFNQATDVAPYGPIVFNNDISFYFNSLSSVQNVLSHIRVGILLSAFCLPLTLFQVEVYVDISVEFQLMVQNIRIP